MRCPHCKFRLGFYQFCTTHPLKPFQCAKCATTLIMDGITRGLCIVTFGIVIASFFFTFPVMDEIIESQTGTFLPYIIEELLPVVVIPLQVVLLYIPVALFAWVLGRLRIVDKK